MAAVRRALSYRGSGDGFECEASGGSPPPSLHGSDGGLEPDAVDAVGGTVVAGTPAAGAYDDGGADPPSATMECGSAARRESGSSAGR